MIKLLINNQEVGFSTTVFPDGTSQVWKIEKDMFHDDTVQILWMFESEVELFHVCQLATLLSNAYDTQPTLMCPYLPYGRQDKKIDNHASFALTVAKTMLMRSGITEICAFDVHSDRPGINNISPVYFQKSVLDHHVVCFPDKGAKDRYSLNLSVNSGNDVGFIHAEKVRNQDTGDITGLDLITNSISLTDKTILIVDDICDGGMTFIKLAQKLKEYKPARIDLAVSHGLFSKGKQVLHDAGISNIYTTNSLLRNPEGFKVI